MSDGPPAELLDPPGWSVLILVPLTKFPVGGPVLVRDIRWSLWIGWSAELLDLRSLLLYETSVLFFFFFSMVRYFASSPTIRPIIFWMVRTYIGPHCKLSKRMVRTITRHPLADLFRMVRKVTRLLFFLIVRDIRTFFILSAC